MSTEEDTLLTNLCAICHITAPKYRCPRCSIRTCSLPCTRRHKLWSQCTGIRDPAAYLRRSELATESAFDRDFNFITGIERRIERAGRDAENRGVDVLRPAVVGLEHEAEAETPDKNVEGGPGGKRKRGEGHGHGHVVKGEAGFMRRAADAGVRVIKAPRGMSRGKVNGSKWHQRHKCLHWTIEWVTEDGKKRLNCAESCTVAEAYDRAFPLSTEERERRQQILDQAPAENGQVPETTQGETGVSGAGVADPQSTTVEPPTDETTAAEEKSQPESSGRIAPHRNVYFYLHRPRTATKQLVVSPVGPDVTLTSALRSRVVLEFPTIYVLWDSLEDAPQREGSKFILETEYLRTHQVTEPEVEGIVPEDADNLPSFGISDTPDVDEGKVLEVLKKDLLGTAPVAGTP